LSSACKFEVAELNSPEEYIKEGPTAIFLYHPALGPLYSIISQKIQGGKLAKNGELQIEAAEVQIRNLSIDGSFLIKAQNVMGAKNNDSGLLEYGPNVGRIVLENVRVENQGIDRKMPNAYAKNVIQRKESAVILLHGHSEFVAKNVTFKGNI